MARQPVAESRGGGRIRVTQVRGRAGVRKDHLRILHGLGLGRPNRSVVLEDTPSIRGMVFKVVHMVKVESVAAAEVKAS